VCFVVIAFGCGWAALGDSRKFVIKLVRVLFDGGRGTHCIFWFDDIDELEYFLAKIIPEEHHLFL
jgi:hypothetical protein